MKITFRFWGKIFGLKNMYYVIECEWTNAELQRKLSVRYHVNCYIIYIMLFLQLVQQILSKQFLI